MIAENRRSLDGLLAALRAELVCRTTATGTTHQRREAVTAFYTGQFNGMPMDNRQRPLGLGD
ncbi:MAG: hypothetical protein IT318_06555 [Anaerolineales bacterium]|nr:hypothetical protein [Anaerolineales bacterium]